MAKKLIYVDKKEIVLIILGKKVESLNLTADKISRIQFDRINERKFLKKVPSEKISFTIRGRENLVTYTKMKDKEFFEVYKEDVRRFAKENRVTFADNLEKAQ